MRAAQGIAVRRMKLLSWQSDYLNNKKNKIIREGCRWQVKNIPNTKET
jgi:hypothetical protein